jgi:hypothetical protein
MGAKGMKKTMQAAALALGLAAGSLGFGLAAYAQDDNARVYDNGPVWRVSAIEVKPGMFNTYLKYLSTNWRAIQEAEKKTGDVLSYKILAADSVRDHEPDLFLMVEYKNMAVFDRSLKDQDAETAAVFGSLAKARDSSISREAMRTPRGQVLLRELKFTN